MSLSPAAAALIERLLHELGIDVLRPCSLEVHFDRAGIPQEIKAPLSFRRVVDKVDKRA